MKIVAFGMQLARRAQAIAGASWDDRDQVGTLAEQLDRVAQIANQGTEGDLSETDRAELHNLAAQARRVGL